jgi:hypothetical protein
VSSSPFAWTRAVRDSDLAPTVKLVGLIWGTYMNGDGRAYPSVTTIAARAGVGRRTVQRALRDLEGAGLLEPVNVAGGRGHAGEYRALKGVTGDALSSGKGVRGDTLSGAERAPQATVKGVTGDTPTTKKRNGGALEGRAAFPEGPCERCGEIRALVDEAALYCAECAP